MTEEHLTADLLKQLCAAAKPEEYLLQGETIDRELPDYLNELLSERGLKRADVVRASAVNETFIYDIFKGKSLPGVTMPSKSRSACTATLPKRSGSCASQAFQSFGPSARGMRSSSGASNTTSRWLSATTSSIVWASRHSWIPRMVLYERERPAGAA